MTEIEEPRGIAFIKDALAERLGRPAATRVAKSNPSEWYIFDSCFSVIQRGVGSSNRGYRSGIQVRDGDISFYNVHSRTPAKLLRTNLKQRPEAIISAAEGCLHVRNYLVLDSVAVSMSRLLAFLSLSVTALPLKPLISFLLQEAVAIALGTVFGYALSIIVLLRANWLVAAMDKT